MRAAIRIDGEVVYLYPVHLKSERGGHESDAKRIAQASIVRRNYLQQLADNQHVVGAIHHQLGDLGWGLDPLDRCHRAAVTARTVHDGRVKLHDAGFVR